ncbi:MAG: hypothetical protein IKQ94_04005 [Bacteroidales bacterium]|nr:hypothetical protein [Bacteroidales bacterium]
MKQIFSFLGIALVASCMILVSCDKEENNNNNQNNQQQYPDFNLDGFNLAHQWDIYVDDFNCPDFSETVMGKIQDGIDAGNLEISFYGGDEADESNNYRNWILDFTIPNTQTGNGSLVVARMDINYYNPQTQRLYLGTNEDDYDNTVTFTQDSKKIKFYWEAESERGGAENSWIGGYINKADVRF